MLLRIPVSASILVLSLTIFGCTKTIQSHPQDPLEGWNRGIFKFNKAVDTVVMKPVSYVYLAVLPKPIQLGIGNFFDNLREITNVANDVLQLKFAYAAHDTSRFMINTTLGIGGIFDPASSLGLEHRKEDFGQTLYHWGYKESAYFVIPFLGPSTIRDASGMIVDYYGLSVWPWINSDYKFILLGLDFIDIRARILRKETVLDVLAVDEYVFMRDAYFQHRKYLFNESQEPSNDEEELVDDIFSAKHKSSDKVEASKVKQKTNEKNTDKTGDKKPDTLDKPVAKESKNSKKADNAPNKGSE